MLNNMRALWTLILLLFSLALYGCFGVICGVIYKATSYEVKKSSMESTPVFFDFLISSSVNSIELSPSDIQGSVVYIMIKNASKQTKTGESVVLPSLPLIEANDYGVQVKFPVNINTIFGRMESGIVFDFSADEKFEFVNLKVGNAKIPEFAKAFISKAVLSHYDEVFGKSLDAIKTLRVKIIDGKFKISK